MLRAFRRQTSSDENLRLEIKTELPLDRAVKWLSVYMVGILGAFLLIMMALLNARSSIFCEPIGRAGNEDNKSYDQTMAEYNQAFCLENMIDYSDALVRAPATLQFDGATGGEPAEGPVIRVSGPGKVLYQRYFPYTLIMQALLCACPLFIWRVYSTEILQTSVKFIGEGLKDFDDSTDKSKEVPKAANKSGSHEEIRKPSSDTSSPLHEMKQQIQYWSTKRELIKIYIIKLLLHEILLIFIICFYLCFDVFYGLGFKSDFVCYVNKRVLVECNFPGASVLRIFWLVNLLLVDLALLLNTIQLINTNCCMRRPNKYFFLEWSHADKERKGLVFASDSHLISAVCYENLSVLPSKEALRAIQELKTKTSKCNGDIPEITAQSGSTDSLPESESSYCTAPRPSQAGLPNESKDRKLISDV